MAMMDVINMIDIIDAIGVFAFAISGIRMAANKGFDLFGAFVVGFATAIGGGTYAIGRGGEPCFDVGDK